jgi:monofunctional biosynthetic peptidoglycan transglycosylase
MKVFKYFVFCGLFIFFLYLFAYPFLFRVKSLESENPVQTALMIYRIHQWKSQGKNIRISHTWVPLKRISPYLVKAVLISEDDKFFQHEGFDLEGIKLAIEKNIKKKKLKYGGSTISQQLAKNLFLGPRKSLVRKIHEAILTVRIEKTLSKRRILELYLNVAEWGPGIFGIEAASEYYFSKPAITLTPEEAALLAAVLPNPQKYSPVNPSRYISQRAEKILYIMKLRNIISEEYDSNVTKSTHDSLSKDSLGIYHETPQDTLNVYDTLPGASSTTNLQNSEN